LIPRKLIEPVRQARTAGDDGEAGRKARGIVIKMSFQRLILPGEVGADEAQHGGGRPVFVIERPAMRHEGSNA
jgi:hypothetical protein